MKKYIFILICGVILNFPIFSFAKKVTCSNNDYNAIVEIDKEKIDIGEKAYIKVTNEDLNNMNSDIEVEYKVLDKNIVSVIDGEVTPLKEGKTTIKTEIIFAENSSCILDLPIEVVSSDSSLKHLELEELGDLQEFRSDNYQYEINVPYNYEKINIIAEANNPNAKITGDGRRYLNEGINEYEIIITATDGSTSTYKIIINRETASDDTTLQNLIVEGYVLTPKFDKNTYKYTLNVDKEVNEVTISAVPTFSYATVRGTGTFALASGQNTYKIVVTAENGNEEQYEIVVNKNKGLSKLDTLEITDIKLDSDFRSDKYIYYATINSNLKVLDINATSVDDDQIEIIGNDELSVGENEIIIRVTGLDKSSTTYKIIANKLSVEEEIKIEKNDMLLRILLIMFIISIMIMVTLIIIFIKRNYKRNIKKIKRKGKNKKK